MSPKFLTILLKSDRKTNAYLLIWPQTKKYLRKRYLYTTIARQGQSHYIEVVQGVIFMEQNMRFGLIFGRLVVLKKKDLGRL